MIVKCFAHVAFNYEDNVSLIILSWAFNTKIFMTTILMRYVILIEMYFAILIIFMKYCIVQSLYYEFAGLLHKIRHVLYKSDC